MTGTFRGFVIGEVGLEASSDQKGFHLSITPKSVNRRTALSVLASSTTLLSGCSAIGDGSPSSGSDDSDDSSGVTLRSVVIENRFDEPTEFDTTIDVGGGKNQFHSEVSIPPGEVVSPATAWENPAESFVVVGNQEISSGIEVVSMNDEENRTDTPLLVKFVIDEQGGLEWELNTTESR